MIVTELKIGGYRFEQPTHYGALHLGTDYSAKFIPIEYPITLKEVTYKDGEEGGLTVEGVDELGYIHRFLHLDEFKTNAPVIPANMLFAITGASGNLGSKNGHLHRDIRKPNTRHLPLHIKNFIDPEIYDKEILPNLLPMIIPQWFKDNGTDIWAQTKFIRIDQTNLTESDCKELESLKKATMPADVTVNMFSHKITLAKEENDALKQAVRHTGLIYDNYVNLLFEAPEKLNMELTGITSGKLQGFTPKRGLNVVIVEDKLLDSLKDKNLNGLAFVNQNTVLVQKSLLLKSDSRNRNNINAMAGTLPHELCHIFGSKLDFTQPVRKDLTHDFDTNEKKPFYTISNYLPKLAWALLHDKNFRINNSL